jgi:mRNA interferase MazF
MTGYEFGDVVLVPFPFTDQSATKRRPAVIISSPAYYRVRLDLIIMAVTSQRLTASALGDVVVEDTGGEPAAETVRAQVSPHDD